MCRDMSLDTQPQYLICAKFLAKNLMSQDQQLHIRSDIHKQAGYIDNQIMREFE